MLYSVCEMFLHFGQMLAKLSMLRCEMANLERSSVFLLSDRDVLLHRSFATPAPATSSPWGRARTPADPPPAGLTAIAPPTRQTMRQNACAIQVNAHRYVIRGFSWAVSLSKDCWTRLSPLCSLVAKLRVRLTVAPNLDLVKLRQAQLHQD